MGRPPWLCSAGLSWAGHMRPQVPRGLCLAPTLVLSQTCPSRDDQGRVWGQPRTSQQAWGAAGQAQGPPPISVSGLRLVGIVKLPGLKISLHLF